jgi:hypothetical protein
MGGFGSGNWRRIDTKSTVEESFVVSVGDFHRRRRSLSSGTLTWTWGIDNESSIGFVSDWSNGRPVYTLHYRWDDCEDIQIPVLLQTTPTQFGGERWWFCCPINGVGCSRRVGKLYLPPGERYFGCRTCHRLTYLSCQAAHRDERLFASVGRIDRWSGALESRSQ